MAFGGEVGPAGGAVGGVVFEARVVKVRPRRAAVGEDGEGGDADADEAAGGFGGAVARGVSVKLCFGVVEILQERN